jgi:Zn finger protein HypA/HybF involved in hydrogenase expression
MKIRAMDHKILGSIMVLECDQFKKRRKGMGDVSVSNFEVTCKKCGRKLEPQYYDPNEKLAIRLICPGCKAKLRIIVGG